MYAIFPVLAASVEGLVLDGQPLAGQVFQSPEHAQMAADLVFNWPMGKHVASVAPCTVGQDGKATGFDYVSILLTDEEDHDCETSFAMVG